MLWLLCLLLPLKTGSLVSGSAVRGAEGQLVTLPCTYLVNAENAVTSMCWGRGPCSTYRCTDEILRTDGWNVTQRRSSRYQLRSDIHQGNVSLTIEDLNPTDSGIYCCRVEISGWFNDQKLLTSLEVDPGSLVSGSAVRGAEGQSVTLPCIYPLKTRNDVTTMCWGRGLCPNSGCTDEILKTDGWNVTWSSSSRHQLRRDIPAGDVSLTIEGVNPTDSGTYCCRVEIPGWFNDQKHTTSLEVDPATTTPNSSSTTTNGSVYSGTDPSSTTYRPQVTSTNSTTGPLVHLQQNITTASVKPTYIPLYAAVPVLLLILAALVAGFYIKRRKMKKNIEDSRPLPMTSAAPGGLASALESPDHAEDNIYTVE